jgi:hypothetical protein
MGIKLLFLLEKFFLERSKMMKRKLVLSVWTIVFTGIYLSFVVEGAGADTLYKTSLTVSDSSAFDGDKLDASVEINKNGKVKLSISNLIHLDTLLYANKTCALVIETEVNDIAKPYEFPFEIEEGIALEDMALVLQSGDKVEIVSVVINEKASPTGTPTPSPIAVASPLPAGSPTPVATASPIATTSPVVTPTATVAPYSTSVLEVSAEISGDDVELLVPGGLITDAEITPTPTSFATPAATPTEPSATPTSTPVETPSVIEAYVSFQSKTINLNSNGKFIANIKLPSTHNIEDIVCETVVCEGAVAIDCDEKKNKLKVKFNISDLEVGLDLKTSESQSVEFTITGELSDGTKFEGSDTVKVKGSKKGKNDDNDDEDEDDDDGDKGKDKGKGKNRR